MNSAKSPLDPKLRALVRWAAADANKSPYGVAYALADLKRAGRAEPAGMGVPPTRILPTRAAFRSR